VSFILQLEQKKKIQDEKKIRVINIIATNAINPQTKGPHPPARIEAAMNEAGVHIDPMKTWMNCRDRNESDKTSHPDTI